MKTISFTALLTGILSLTACAHPNHADGANSRYIQVYKHDGSQQCYAVRGISPEKMANELQGIRIYASGKHVLTGVMFPAVCGGVTGSVNVYTIDAKDRSKAAQRGFHVLEKKD
ncbi:Uncharacterised protein [Neisseria zoodegmatis]|uniref:Lipoprotein n=1 Tax=Neisseria zoodegmatis TaxID=326523 RepID=A0A378WJM3_9NEIS|nr:hypothetical protein [Neisseria zoodegmatis]SUA36663.1 Uncharacterised protein [Neisseria zoodegmatis]